MCILRQRGHSLIRRLPLRSKTQGYQRKRSEFTVYEQMLVFLKFLEGLDRIRSPLAGHGPFVIPFVGERLLDFFISLGSGCALGNAGGPPGSR